MGFPAGDNKIGQYGACSDLLADSLGYLGREVPEFVRERWRDVLSGIATADDVAEKTPEVFSSRASVYDYLIDTMHLTVNEQTLEAAVNMVNASSCSVQAKHIEDYLDSRRNEALFSTDFLKAQTPELSSEKLWFLIGNMAVAGIYLDTLYDAKEDARHLTHFTAKELAWGSGKRLWAETRQLGPEVVSALSRSAVKNGLAGHLVRKLPQKLS